MHNLRWLITLLLPIYQISKDCFIAVSNIDSVSVPFGVSEVSFTSDLKGIECLSCESQIVKESSLYKSLF